MTSTLKPKEGMMGEFIFGLRRGWLPKKAESIAKKHGAWLVENTDPQCTCGQDCWPGECKRSRYHWFATESKGDQSNLETARKVHDDLTTAGIYPQENDLNTAIQLLKRIHLIGPAPIPSELQKEVDMFLKKLTSS
jgi:hypothetical protein